MKKNIIPQTLAIILFINLQVQAQHKKITIKGLVNAKPTDTFNVFNKDSVKVGDTVVVEVIYDIRTSMSSSLTYRGTSGNIFSRVDSNFFRARIKNKYDVNIMAGRIVEYQFDIQNDTVLQGKTIDKLNVYARGVSLPLPLMWSFCRMEVTAIDSTANVWSTSEFPLPENLQPLANPASTIHIWGESNTVNREYMDIMATIFSVQISDYILQNAPTSTTALTAINSFNISPNPSATGLFYIEADTQPTQWQVYNARGIQVFAPIISTPSNYTLDLSLFPKGMYLLVMHINGKMVAKKIGKE